MFNTCLENSLLQPPRKPAFPGPQRRGAGRSHRPTRGRTTNPTMPRGEGRRRDPDQRQATGVKVRASGRGTLSVRSRRGPHRPPSRHSLTDSSASSLARAEASEKAASAANQRRHPGQSRHDSHVRTAAPRPHRRRTSLPPGAPPRTSRRRPAPRGRRLRGREGALLVSD